MTETERKTEPQPSNWVRKIVAGSSHISLENILSLGLALMAALTPVRADDAVAPLFPFVISYDAQENASSMAHLLDAPDGKHGFTCGASKQISINKIMLTES